VSKGENKNGFKGFKAPSWYGNQTIPIVGQKKDLTENEKLRRMLENLANFCIEKGILTPEEIKQVMKEGKLDEPDVESDAGTPDLTVS
jgi:hypothetical protein